MGHWTYLVFEVAWALPVIGGQWIVGRDRLLAQWRILLLGVLIPTLYLCAADAFAIHVGIWHLNPELTTGIWIGALPLEEGVFFLLTNVMVVQGVLLFYGDGVSGSVESRRAGRPLTPPSPTARA